MANPLHRRGFLRAGIADADFFVEFLVDRDIHRLVDAGGNHRAAKTAVKDRQIAAASHKTDPQGRPADNHTLVLNKIGRTAWRRLSARRSGWLTNLPSAPPWPVRSRIERRPAFFAVSRSVVLSPMSQQPFRSRLRSRAAWNTIPGFGLRHSQSIFNSGRSPAKPFSG